MSSSNSSRDLSLDVTCERALVKQLAHTFLHAALFQRALGVVTARRIECCDLSFAAIQDVDMIAQIEEHAETFSRATDSKGRGRLRLSFYEKPRSSASTKPRAPSSWFAAGVTAAMGSAASGTPTREDQPWERWTLDVVVAPAATERERNQVTTITRSQLATFQLALLRFCNDNRAHIPAITKEGIPYPYEIEVNPGSTSTGVEGWAGGLRRMLSEPAPAYSH